MAMCIRAICALLFAVNAAFAAKILIIYAHNAASHLGSLTPLIKTLSFNHDVTILQTGETDIKRSVIGNATSVLWSIESKTDFRPTLSRLLWTSVDHSDKLFFLMNTQETAFGEFINQLPDKVTALLNENWDLLITDALFTNHGFAFTSLLRQKRKIPYVMFQTTFSLSHQNWALSHGGSWVAQPPLLAPPPTDTGDIYQPSDFSHRLVAFSENAMEYASSLADFKNSVKLGMSKITLFDVIQHSSLILSDEIIGFGHNLPVSDHFQIVGQHCAQSGELPEDIAKFVNDPTSKGTVYVAFGTIVRFDFAPEFIINEFFDALDSLNDYRIIFTFSGPTYESHKRLIKRSHVKLVKWAPQLDVLAHPRTKLFFSHGGLKSIKEAICTSTPMVILPFFAEQGRNAKVAVKLGLATVLNKLTLTKSGIVGEIQKILENNDYQRKMNNYKSMYLDRPVEDLKKAQFFVERVLRRTEGALRHKNRGQSLLITSTFFIDFLAIISTISFICSK